MVDGNVTRVLARLLALPGAAGERALLKRLWQVAGELVAGPHPGELNQALMELGATLCTPTQPACAACPVRRWCRGCAGGEPTRFPQAAAPPRRRLLRVAFLWLLDERGVWLARRPLEGLWAGLWELPSAHGGAAKAELAARFGVELGRPLASVTHTLTHREVQARIYRPTPPPRLRRRADLQHFPALLTAPLSGLARKAIRRLVES